MIFISTQHIDSFFEIPYWICCKHTQYLPILIIRLTEALLVVKIYSISYMPWLIEVRYGNTATTARHRNIRCIVCNISKSTIDTLQIVQVKRNYYSINSYYNIAVRAEGKWTLFSWCYSTESRSHLIKFSNYINHWCPLDVPFAKLNPHLNENSRYCYAFKSYFSSS